MHFLHENLLSLPPCLSCKVNFQIGLNVSPNIKEKIEFYKPCQDSKSFVKI